MSSTPDWIAKSVARVTKKYRPTNLDLSKPTWQWPGRATSVFAFEGDIPSHSNPKLVYHVWVKWDGSAHCTCQGFGYRHTCSHIKAVKDVLGETH